MLQLDHIYKSYGDHHVLKDINLHVDQGDVVSLIGPSGTGKTTLLRTINYLEPADKGIITINGISVNTEKAKQADIIKLRRQTAMVFQNYSLFRNKTVLENVTEGLTIVQGKSKEEAEEVAVREISRVGMADNVDKYPYQLSGGQQQRLCIARALAVQPEVLLMDEPTSALDPISTAKIEDLMEELKKKYTVVVVTHNMQQALRVSDDTAFFLVGEMVEFGSTKDLFSYPQDKRTEDYITGRFG